MLSRFLFPRMSQRATPVAVSRSGEPSLEAHSSAIAGSSSARQPHRLEIRRDAVVLPEPVTMVAGAALVSAPIIIHLINRMRFRRVKWAAMEFLLKAQKRMRRKMIIEQLILLFLRCLLMFLLGLLFARFLGFDPLQGKETRPTVHVVILDDTPEHGRQGPRRRASTTDAFAEAPKQITDRIMPAALEATTTQSIRILRLSDQADLLNSDPDPAKDRGAAEDQRRN